MIVPLPPPDGELTTKSVPLGEGWLTGPANCNSFTLLDILNLFAKFLHFCFDRQAGLLDGQVRRFGKRCNCLAVELLKQKWRNFANRFRMSSKVKELQLAGPVNHAPSRGTLFVVSSPSGGGKGTIIRHVLDVVENLSYSVSYTTRAPGQGEVDGREYFFISRETFDEMVVAREFLEWACVHGNFYGTSKKQIMEETAAGSDIFLEVDVQGAASVRQLLMDSVSIFILPASYEVLRQRLIARGTDSPPPRGGGV